MALIQKGVGLPMQSLVTKNIVNLTFTTEDIRRMSGDPDLTNEMAEKVLKFLHKSFLVSNGYSYKPRTDEKFTVSLIDLTLAE